MADSESLSSYWWKEKNGKIHETLFGIIRFLDQHQNYISQQNLRAMRLYGNLNVLGLSAHNYSQSASTLSPVDRISLNIVQSMCDTVTQKIAKNKPKPTFLTSGGDFGLKKKAKLLEKFVQGQFYATDLYQLAPRIFLDATIFGTGALKIYREGNEIKIERTFIDELKVDNSEGMYGKPRSYYQVKHMPKEVMVTLYPSHRDKILAAKRPDNSAPTHSSLSNTILVTEAWHLSTQDGKAVGRHVICIENDTLLDEPYNKTYPPFVIMRWSQRLLGFWGQGLAEQLTGIQIEINKILRTIQMAFHLAVPKLMVENGSKVVMSHLNNEIGSIVKYTGTKPEWAAFAAIHPQFFEHLERLYQKAYEIAGVSQLAAQSKKPGGLDSGKALREFNDIEAERFILVGQAWENFFMEAAKQMIELGKEIHEEDEKYEVTVKGRKFIEKINWGEIDLKEDEYVMQVFPTSMLSSTPAGKLQDVQELIQAGFIDKANALRLLDYPDLESYMNLANAAIEDIENMIEAMVDRGEYQTPEPFQNLEMGITMMQSAYLRAKSDNVPEENLELLRRWMEEAKATLDRATAQAAPPPPTGMPAGSPTGVPQAPPTSDLIPNAPGAMAQAM